MTTLAQPTEAVRAAGFAPLTESQVGLLVVHRAVPAAHLYNVVAEVELDPRHPAPAIRAAVATVLAVQPALRLGLREAPKPHAVLAEPGTAVDAPIRAAQVPAADFDEQKPQLLSELATTAFDLAEPPLLRGTHLHAADGSRSVLLLVVHHTVFDGYSLRPFVTDLDAALRGDLDAPGLRPRRERALRRELEAQVGAAADPEVDTVAEGMAERVRRAPATVLNPRPNRPTTTDFTGGRIALRLDEAESARLDQARARLDVSAFTFFSAVYAAVLGRHSGNDSVVFGSPLMARRTVASHDLCGFFVNTLPLVVDVPWSTGFDSFVRERVAPEVDRARAGVAVPFNRVVRHAAPDRLSNRNPLFSCMLAMQDSTEVDGGSTVLALREHGTDTAKFDLWLGVTPTARGWLLELEHDTALLPAAVAEGVVTSLREALHAVAADVTTPLADLFTDASATETATTDGFWREPAATGLDGWLGADLAERADAVAVEERGRTLTYRQVEDAVLAMAGRLRDSGVTAGQVVGLATAELADTIVTIQALLRLRAVYLPIDLTQPADRIAYMLAKSECSLVVGTAELDGARVIAPVDAWHHHGEPAKGEATAPESGDDGVYVMFTSGSTGKPKGVLMHNGPLVNLTAWQVDALGMGPSTRFLQYAPCGFDVSFQEIVPTLVAGGTVVSRDDVDRRDFPALVAHVRDTAVTHLYLPVAALQPLAQAAMAAGERFEHLTHLCASGEQLVVGTEIQRFFAERPHVELVNLYGPTETHAVTTHRLREGAGGWDPHVPIGRPITGVTAQVVDRTGHLAPKGVLGELLLGGRCPARGYLNDGRRTDERFRPDPYNLPDGRRYTTGDQVMWSPDGLLLFLGRNDDQVKIRGFRVELGEVEAAAQERPGVKRAVAAVAGEGAQRHLLLFLQPEGAAEVDVEQVRGALADGLPAYMVPTRVLVVETIPTTGNGKIDRPALVAAAGDLARGEAAEDTAAADLSGDPVEAWLQELWAELLGGALPAADRSLLEVGAHSLNVLTALTRVRQEWGVQLTILDFFGGPTVAATAATIRERGGRR
ncbi:non-ribosomal peptide synthetase [Actinokineospora sp. G85]|uniref:non-ribosomal peptide synthetase n=1 Tax=Actinokineospora sp. G85 TaxID=3406626 RepID=UPI003C71BF9A